MPLKVGRLAAVAVCLVAVTGLWSQAASATSYSTATVSAKAGPLAPQAYTDFRVPGVRIWKGPSASTTIMGLGYPGQGYNVYDVYGGTESYTCDNGQTTWTWIHGWDVATGVAGYVPSCNLDW